MSALPTLPPVLDVRAVMDRYGLRDRRAARRIMDEAGGFHIAGRLVVRLDDLDAHERSLRDGRRSPERPQEAIPAPPRARRSSTPRAPRTQPLRPGWWREADTSNRG